MNQLLEMTALEQAALLRAGEISSAELTHFYLQRAQRFNDDLTAFVAINPKRALAAARRADQLRRRVGADQLPLLHGMPIGIKDLVPIAGERTRFGSNSYKYFIAPFSAEVAKRLRRGGLISIGKLATSEFGVMPVTEPTIHKPTANPWDLERSPGGSSGGSGAAVAAGLVPFAHGSDGGGSIRIPSSFCHLYGFKASLKTLGNLHGRVNGLGMSVMGPLARGVEDGAALLDVMTPAPNPAGKPGPFLQAARRQPKPLKIHLLLSTALGEADPAAVAAARQTAALLTDLGHQIIEVRPPQGSLQTFLPVYQYMVSRIPVLFEGAVEPVTRWLRLGGRNVSLEDAQRAQATLCASIADTFGDADLLLSPTIPIPAPRHRQFVDPDPAIWFENAAEVGAFTAAFNLTNGPAASLPAGFDSAGMPVGVQIGGRVGADELLFSVSAQIESAAPWRQHWPKKYAP